MFHNSIFTYVIFSPFQINQEKYEAKNQDNNDNHNHNDDNYGFWEKQAKQHEEYRKLKVKSIDSKNCFAITAQSYVCVGTQGRRNRGGGWKRL